MVSNALPFARSFTFPRKLKFNPAKIANSQEQYLWVFAKVYCQAFVRPEKKVYPIAGNKQCHLLIFLFTCFRKPLF
jgi:hypothetical protein